MTKYLLALDPGETTGYCVADYNGVIKEAGQFPAATRLDHILMIYKPKVTVMESFRVRVVAAVIGSTVPTLKIIGVMEYLCAQRGSNVVWQQPSQKAFFDNGRLKRLGLYRKAEPHATDAIRHLFYYLTFTVKTVSLASVK